MGRFNLDTLMCSLQSLVTSKQSVLHLVELQDFDQELICSDKASLPQFLQNCILYFLIDFFRRARLAREDIIEKREKKGDIVRH